MDHQGFRVPQAGLEPARQKRHRILSPACLPVPPPGHGMERKTGFEPATPTEPPRLSAPDPKSGVATNYTTSAEKMNYFVLL